MIPILLLTACWSYPPSPVDDLPPDVLGSVLSATDAAATLSLQYSAETRALREASKVLDGLEAAGTYDYSDGAFWLFLANYPTWWCAFGTFDPPSGTFRPRASFKVEPGQAPVPDPVPDAALASRWARLTWTTQQALPPELAAVQPDLLPDITAFEAGDTVVWWLPRPRAGCALGTEGGMAFHVDAEGAIRSSQRLRATPLPDTGARPTLYPVAGAWPDLFEYMLLTSCDDGKGGFVLQSPTHEFTVTRMGPVEMVGFKARTGGP